ncbi:hypothetical protein SIO70_30420 [Chitinophaga sancti]|uniref:hypothetical protein n=1 Tax=Chitinophaga sancti TaxID=1004 RepID=UPI002A75ADC4|nr:hypothetical protein [Chitinophaga sancti]WPQ62677.1 hypothetical protein SIO70_30420 [Chitinophaga sancti]
MNMQQIIPTNFVEWKFCITQQCQIQLTSHFINSRISELENLNSKSTTDFIALYGDKHWQNVLTWFKKALSEQMQI